MLACVYFLEPIYSFSESCVRIGAIIEFHVTSKSLALTLCRLRIRYTSTQNTPPPLGWNLYKESLTLFEEDFLELIIL